MWIEWFAGIVLMGWFNYLEVDGRENGACVAVRTIHILGMPLWPVEALVVYEPSPSAFGCLGKARCRSFRTRCNNFLWKGFLFSWLRFILFFCTLGLSMCWKPKGDAADVMEAVGIVVQQQQQQQQQNNNQQQQQDNKEQYYNSFTPANNNEEDNRNRVAEDTSV